MKKDQFIKARNILKKTQKEMSVLLGVSLRAIHSYEQEWRNIPVHVERQIYFLLSRKNKAFQKIKPCWNVMKCSGDIRETCPAWEFRAGKLCWFINGTVCEGMAKKTWKEKMEICRKCVMLENIFAE